MKEGDSPRTILGPIVMPAASFLARFISDYLQGRPIRAKTVGNNHRRSAVAFHRPLQKLESGLPIPPFRGENLKHFAFVIHGTPEVMCLTVDPDEHLIQVPSLLRI